MHPKVMGCGHRSTKAAHTAAEQTFDYIQPLRVWK
jgi:hypothetical protein